MSRVVFFEWADYEQNVMETVGLQAHAELRSELFNLEAARNAEAISIFVDSKISNQDIDTLAAEGTRVIAIRAAGFDMLDSEYAKSKGISVFRVASYSPESVAEHAFALLLNLIRKLNVEREKHELYLNRRTLQSMGRTLRGKKLGLYGVGRIGSVMFEIAKGFGMEVAYFDKYVENFPGAQRFDSLAELFSFADIVSVHVPLTDETRYSINEEVLNSTGAGTILINVSRGDIADSAAVVRALDNGKLTALGVDVWDSGAEDDKFDQRLLRLNVMQTQHVAFFTFEAVKEILEQTLASIAGNADNRNRL